MRVKLDQSKGFVAASPNVFTAVRPLEAAGGRQFPAMIAAEMPPPAAAARSGPAAPIGIFLYLVSLAFVAVATIGVFFGVAFSLLPHPADALIAQLRTRGPGEVMTVPQGGLPSVSATTQGAPHAAPVIAAAPPIAGAPPPAGSAAPMPRPTLKVVIVAPTAAPATIDQNTKAPAAPRLPDRQLAALVARGDILLRAGDIASARLFYERAADDGDGHAALRVGATFDPTFLASVGFRNMSGDPAKALFWYRRALGLGAGEAQYYLNRINTKSNGEHRE
jgi:hypothetical protein